MKKIYRIFLLLLIFIFLTTYSSKNLKDIGSVKKTFFQINNIIIINNYMIEKSKIVKKINHIYGKNILFIKNIDLEEPLQDISFLEKIEVKKKYPDTLLIKVYETKIIAVLFKKNDKYFLDSSSNLIPFKESISQKSLPSVFGDESEKYFLNFINNLKNNNFSDTNIKNYYYFQSNRWDVQLLNGQVIKFPSSKIEKAIQQSVELLNREDFKNYSVIDLRVHGKIVVE